MKRYGPKPRRQRKSDDPHWKKFFDEDQREEARRQELLETSLADAGLQVRTTNNLEKHKIFNVGMLAAQTREQLLEIDNIGEQTLAEIAKAMDDLGVEHPDWSKPKPPKPAKKGKKK